MLSHALSATEVQQDQACLTPDARKVLTADILLGKTLLAKTLARVLDVPFSVSDATSFTQVCVLSHCVCCESNPSQRQDVRRYGPGRQIHR